MPAGLSWPKYFGLLGSSMFFLFLGSQAVHAVYRPLDDLDQYIENYKQEQRKLLKEKGKS